MIRKLQKHSRFLFLMILSFLVFTGTVKAQEDELIITGTVTSADDGLPIPGVTILIQGTNQGTSTDFDGNYEITAAPNSVLVFSYMGFTTKEVPVNGQSELNISMEVDSSELDEVIVVGYGTQRRTLVTGANVQVDGDDIQNQSTTNALQALQGQTPGVQITSTSGQPGSGMDVVIRGMGSTGDNSPLYVVDGVLTGDISYLNNADIESISVLKDAASAAIYGSQASNGVVLVTTKSGKSGTSRITLDTYYGFQSVPDKIDLLDSREYATIINEAALNSGSQRFFSNEEIAELGEGTNWMDEMFVDNAITENYTLSFSGGSETSTFSSSLAYTGDEGVVGGKDLSNYERINFRLNSEHKLYDGLITFGENLTFAYINSNGVSVGNQYSNTLRNAFGVPSLVPMYNEEGDYYDTSNDSDPWLTQWANPYASMVYNNQNESNNQKLLGNVYAEIQILDNLKFRTSLGLDYFASEGHSYQPIYQLSVYSFRNRDRVYQSQSKGHSLLWNNLLTYDFNLFEDHEFEVLLGSEAYSYKGTYMDGSNVDLIFNDLKHSWLDNALNNSDASQIQIGGGPNAENKRMSYFGRLNYSYLDKYLINATFRADGSSNFGQGNRWGYFPSISAGWIASEEDFLIDSETISFLKFRASWGQVGNQNAGAFQYLAPITFANTNYNFGDEEGVLTPGAYPSRLANPDLQWETSEQANIGLDARLFNNSLNINLDLYNKTTRDWLIRAPILATAGADAPFINGGDVTNRGIELAIGYGKSHGDFSYNVSVNGAYNENEVGNIPTEDGIIHGATNQLFDNAPEFYRAESGFPLGYFWGLETGGVFQNEAEVSNHTANGELIQPSASPGDLRYIDQNNDGVINDMDKINIGDPNPDLTYGINLSFTYKALDFSLRANGVAGNQIVQSYRNQSSQFANHTTAIFDRWTGEGSSNTMPRLTLDNRNFTRFSDIYVQDGDFLRLSNLTIGYDIAQVAENIGLTKMRIYASALNLYTFTNYDGMDPEVGYGISENNYSFSSGVDLGYYPRPRTLMLGLNVTF
ncbi:SusC/RagA family TonB-linked outer membrane protein [Salegentibacter salinarum]|uniref:SusC/RagA family TonB-linked outer membrane protein n=1 Tax=Salegentibacter salinarum TaxID=447422 RepID=A0A2N0U3U3_9FLAO|nr:TonB-dependent receptor [Salegentibacter salinarum]PKD21669.1 SusC/RagA family TonB-linked outer membrane protein [Salegentibacter salinarum]SKB35107.1 TonB-linked outer membrane protein, SusC/RagA family [Salegentibacter salinarum]